MAAPTIESVSWGNIIVNHKGKNERFKDAKVGPAGATAWDWRVTNTAHIPGIQIADIQEYIDDEVEEIILSRGMKLQLQIHPETIEYLSESNIKYFEAQTEKAVAYYNECVANGKRVGGVFHSTC